MSHLFENVIEDEGIDNTKFFIPETMDWGGFIWRLHSTPIFSGNLNSGHYTSLVRHPSSDEFRHFNDDHVQNYRKRVALNRLQNNKFGLVYGLVYLRN